MTANTTESRDGVCVCGVPVRRHFTGANEKLSCEQAKGRPLELGEGWTLVGSVMSDSGAGEYGIYKNGDALACACKAFGFRLDCKHMRTFKAAQAQRQAAS